MLRAFFSDYACEVVEATDGAQAIDAVNSELPDLVVLDVMMPETSGWEVLRYIKERDELSFVKVIMLTGIGHHLNSMTSPIMGADAYLDKPFDLGALEETITELLGPDGIARKP